MGARRTQGKRVCAWVEAFCCFTNGEWIGQPFRFLPWQRRLVYELFEVGEDDLRRYRWALIGVPKKNGKALALDTPLPTPDGWTTMGDVAVGDVLFDERGAPCRVTFVTEVQHGHDCYRVRFSDRSEIVADADHQWLTEELRHEYAASVKTTRDLAASVITRSDGARNHRIRVAGALQLPDVPLPIEPYVLGAWLGDGARHTNTFTTADAGMLAAFRAAGGYRIRKRTCDKDDPYAWAVLGIVAQLRRVLGRDADGGLHKHIPPAYLRASVRQRWDLLQGLMDTDGSCARPDECEFTTTNAALASGVVELLASLGIKSRSREGRARLRGRDIGPKWRIQFCATPPVFRLLRKSLRQHPLGVRRPPARTPRSTSRQIVAVVPVPSVPVRCIQVDSPSHLYLAGRSMVPTHNTELAAALALYLLIGDGEPAPLVACAAASEEQADLVFGAAKRMCELSPALKQITERFDKELLVPSIPGARLIRVAAAAGTNDGKNLHGVICDELHEWAPPKGDNVWNVLTNGTGARRQPLVLQITTAGYDVDGTICGQQYTHGLRVQSGEVDDPTYYFRWQAAPAEADYRDPATWAAANPSYGVTVHEPFFRDQLTKKTEAVFRRYFLNQWTTSEEIWIPETTWDACKEATLDIDPALPLHVGVDMAHSNDSAAVVCAQRQASSSGERTVLRARVWENPYPRTHALYEHWRINPLEVEQHLRDLFAQFPVPAAEVDGITKAGPAFYYDPAWFSRSAPVLEGDGLAMVEFPQTDARMVPASQTLYQLATEGLLAHDGDPVLKRQVLNAVADHRPRGWRLSKPKGSRRKIDACIAAAIGVYGAQERGPAESVYEGRDMVVLG